MRTITLELTEREAESLRFVIGDISVSTYDSLIRMFLPDPAVISLRISSALGMLNDLPPHDWVEVTPHQHAGNERHFICAHCTEFKIEKVEGSPILHL